MTLHDVQCHLDKEGASDLVVDLIIKNHSSQVFLETIELGIALLEGGNSPIQKSFYTRLLSEKNSEVFFKVFFDRMVAAQSEIKTSASVNTTEQLAAKTQENKDVDIEQRKKARTSTMNGRVRNQLDDAAHSTSKAFAQVRGKSAHDDSSSIVTVDDMADKSKTNEEQTISSELADMKSILRFLQLLCENHNRDLQNYLRTQNTKTGYNLVCETLKFLDCICGSTTGGLGLLGLYINEHNVALINQTLESLTEYCQGPCHENQNAIASNESNGIDIIIALILNDINPLGKYRMDLVLKLKNNASKLLLAIMESRHDSENAERILYNMSPKQLVEVAKQAYHQKDAGDNETTEKGDDAEESINPRDVGHNIYILAHQLARHNRELADMLKPEPGDESGSQALEHYAKHTAQIEIVRQDRTMEQIVFPIPEICEYLTSETEHSVRITAERDEQGSKVSDFFSKTEDMFGEMQWQKKLRGQPYMFWMSSHMSLWSNVSFNLAIICNLLVAAFYPFSDTTPELDPRLSGLIWAAMLVSLALVITVPRPSGIRSLVVSTILRLIFSVGLKPTLWLLGGLNIANSCVHLISLMGNTGAMTKSYRYIATDFECVYHTAYVIITLLAAGVHEFFYSFMLLDVVYREETLLNVIRSVTKNGRSILLTAVLAVILIYLFSIVGFIFFQNDFMIEVDAMDSIVNKDIVSAAASIFTGTPVDDTCTNDTCAADQALPMSDAENLAATVDADIEEVAAERHCDSLIMCIITTLNEGLRNGGGIGDVLRKPSSTEPLFFARVVYDLLFFFIVIIIVLNLIFGVIIDTFADLRSEKQQKEEILRNTCFICGLERSSFDNKSVSFEEHCTQEHNMWHYLFFIVLVKVKDATEFTGPESYVHAMIKEKNLDWFPRMRAMSLAAEDSEGEQNELRILHTQLESTNILVNALSTQLKDLKEQMTEQRKQKQRIGLLNNPSGPMMGSSMQGPM